MPGFTAPVPSLSPPHKRGLSPWEPLSSPLNCLLGRHPRLKDKPTSQGRDEPSPTIPQWGPGAALRPPTASGTLSQSLGQPPTQRGVLTSCLGICRTTVTRGPPSPPAARTPASGTALQPGTTGEHARPSTWRKPNGPRVHPQASRRDFRECGSNTYLPSNEGGPPLCASLP